LAQATYNAKYKDHAVKVLAGATSELFTYSNFGASRTGFINPNQPYLDLGAGLRDNNGGGRELALAGFFGRVNYSYNEKYLLEINGRHDLSSRFSQALNNQGGTFASASAGWIFTRENFFNGLSKYVSFGKLRGSIGGISVIVMPLFILLMYSTMLPFTITLITEQALILIIPLLWVMLYLILLTLTLNGKLQTNGILVWI
jgi:TonB dependent receptor